MRLFTRIGYLTLGAAVACGGRQRTEGTARPESASTATRPASALDSLCGTVRVVGSEPAVFVQIEPQGSSPVQVSGAARPSLRFLSGLGVCAYGSGSSAEGWMADRLIVRSHEGEPAVDGVLGERAGAYAVTTEDNREVRLTSLPDALKREGGSRVWVVLDGQGNVKSFGVVR